jgi:aconitase A
MKWATRAFDNFRVGAGIGIVHQVNLEYRARVHEGRRLLRIRWSAPLYTTMVVA